MLDKVVSFTLFINQERQNQFYDICVSGGLKYKNMIFINEKNECDLDHMTEVKFL